jgi:hypothetical protein
VIGSVASGLSTALKNAARKLDALRKGARSLVPSYNGRTGLAIRLIKAMYMAWWVEVFIRFRLPLFRPENELTVCAPCEHALLSAPLDCSNHC